MEEDNGGRQKQDGAGEKMREQLRKWLFWSYSRWDVSGAFRPIRAICDPAFIERMENTEEALELEEGNVSSRVSLCVRPQGAAPLKTFPCCVRRLYALSQRVSVTADKSN